MSSSLINETNVDQVFFCPDRHIQAQLLGLAEEAEEMQVAAEEAELHDTEPDEEEGETVEDPVEVAAAEAEPGGAPGEEGGTSDDPVEVAAEGLELEAD